MLGSIIVPLFDEELRGWRGIQSIQRFLGGERFDCEVVVVDHGSTDATVGITIELIAVDQRLGLLSYSENCGKGHAVKVGMIEARGRTRLFCDIDISVPIEVADNLCESNTRVQMTRDVIGSIAVLTSIRLYWLVKLHNRPKPYLVKVLECDRLAVRFR